MASVKGRGERGKGKRGNIFRALRTRKHFYFKYKHIILCFRDKPLSKLAHQK